ncbi:MAG: Flp pilus assembly protein CpaB [Nitrospira sp. CR2.1]|nr:Flp pilus assembly protein CpaB [Nitrospira sp. CR2.1]
MTPRQKALAVVGIGGMLGALSSLFAYGYVQQLLDETRAELSAGDRKTNVAVAARQLPWGSVLTADAVRIVPFPSESVPDGHFSASEELVGRVLLAPLASQEPILASKLAPTDVVTGGVAAITHPAKRAMAIKVDDVTAVGGVLKSGDRVDILTTMSRTQNGGEPATKLVLNDILVLSTGSDQSGEKADEPLIGSQKASRISPTIVTLEVTPHEAETLSLASMEGKVHLALRNPHSAETVSTPGVTASALFASPPPKSDRPLRVMSRRSPVVREAPAIERPVSATSTGSESAAASVTGPIPKLAPYVPAVPPAQSPRAEVVPLRGGGESCSSVQSDSAMGQPTALGETNSCAESSVPTVMNPDPPGQNKMPPPPAVSVELIRGSSRMELKF